MTSKFDQIIRKLFSCQRSVNFLAQSRKVFRFLLKVKPNFIHYTLFQANNNDTAAIPLEPIANGHGATAAGADTAPARQAGQQAQPLLPQSDTKKPEVLENGLCEVKVEAAKNEVAVESEAVVTPVVTASVVDKNGQQSVTTTQKDQKSPTNDAVDV